MRATRPSEQAPFGDFTELKIDGLPVTARAPVYVYKTRELFYFVPIDEPANCWELWTARAK